MTKRLIAATDPVQRTTTFGYDGDSRKLTTVNAANETNSQTWDARGGLIAMIDGAGHTSLRAYDGAGNQITLTNRNGQKWQFQFDGANRLTNTISPLGRSTSVAFNHQGLISSLKDPKSQTTTYGYDGKGRLASRVDNVGTTAYAYDGNDNRTNVMETGDSTNAWTYDAFNRVSSYRDAFGNLIQYRYDGSGNLTNLIYPGNRNVYYAYDSGNHLTNVTDWANRQTTLTYDLAGRLTGITRPNVTLRQINYDAAGEVTNIVEKTAGNQPIAMLVHDWNAAAEMQWEFAGPLPHAVTVPTRNMTYDADNELATVDGNNVTVDLDGNLTSGPLTNDTFAAYTYDARNRLTIVGGTSSTSPTTNSYDAMNNRIGQTFGTNVTTFVVNPNARLPQVLMRIKNGVTNYYVYGPRLLYQVTETATATNTLTYHYDYRGSTIALTADNGFVTDRMEYSLYATTTYRSGTNDTPFLFNGRYGVMTDPNGLLYMRARYYNPYVCRFLNPDPTGFSGGLNFFAYANGNPVNLVDPLGLDWQFSFGMGGSAGAGADFGFGIAGSSSIGFTSSGQLFMQFQGAGMSVNGAYAGVGLQGGVSYSATPTPSGVSTTWAFHGEGDAGDALSLGLSTDINNDSISGGFPIPGTARFGVGEGAMAGVGASTTTTIATPPIAIPVPGVDRDAETPPVININAPSQLQIKHPPKIQ